MGRSILFIHKFELETDLPDEPHGAVERLDRLLERPQEPLLEAPAFTDETIHYSQHPRFLALFFQSHWGTHDFLNSRWSSERLGCKQNIHYVYHRMPMDNMRLKP